MLNGEMASLPGELRWLAEWMNSLTVDARQVPWNKFLDGRSDKDAIVKAVAAVDLGSAEEEEGPPSRPANLADLRRVMSDSRWHWEGWIPAARLTGIAAFEGVGKTRFALELARRIWFGEEWPDGQSSTFPRGTSTLWVCSDGQQDELADAATMMSLLDDSIHFNTPPDDPYGGTDLDDPESLALLESSIVQVKPAIVFVDTLTNATSKDLCQAKDVKNLGTPLRDIAQRTQTTITLLLHVAKDGEALGRRIKGLTRTIMSLECPDKERSERLRLCVSKSTAKKPPPLGMTICGNGCSFDTKPPVAPPLPTRGRSPEKLVKAIAFLGERLAKGGQKAVDLIDEWESLGEAKATLFNARKAMVEQGQLRVDDSERPQVWHLVRNSESGQESISDLF